MHSYIDIISSVLTALASIVIAIVAIFGYRNWSREITGKRKIELAEDTLSDVLQARDIIRWARFPGGYAQEGQSRPRESGETDAETSEKNSYYVVAERLWKEHSVFLILESKKYRIKFFYGDDLIYEIDKLLELRNEIIRSVFLLVNSQPDIDVHYDCLQKIGRQTEINQEDKFDIELKKIIKNIETHLVVPCINNKI